MVTINDIARQAGVAKSTVSRYLNNGSVSLATREKLDKIVKETGYTPNTFARSLKATKTNMIGVIIPRLNSASTNEVLSGIDQKARESEYDLIITNSNQDRERELGNIQTLINQKVEGIILLAREITESHRKLINDANIPFLVLGQKAEAIHSMAYSDYEAGYKIGQYAIELGHRDFLFFGVSEQDKAVGLERKNGFLESLKDTTDTTVKIIETSFSKKIAYQDAIDALPNSKASYVVCATDNIAIAVLKAAVELKYSVPEKFSISGFGGYEETDYVQPTITTMSYPYKEMGIQAVENLTKLVNGIDIPYETLLPNELIVKNSTIKR
ncbi:LacI family DNA-binding transcriptional regulator [Marinilactibacillus psychrotolerans]|uniref:LacI family transcriptional regulator n=1 Tax=Marinilactibacillus psychrotolerans TaxID=191770 RepID=A0AAV3WPH2_9LACT|nr:LacI family DNA-binding transcriptional regulator [Marinilactibacillus psychrotolerans]GEL66648.1 LacI family transcriptional regulator [Marinilactibacillus psychrotolerans]GEQ35170.1 LacI family transcriptional regulator [Marinilactibacillus psychrotolerans]SDC84509.1 transcriptional regulator, LacI family [Marinilactibacillus psychrotolerans]